MDSYYLRIKNWEKYQVKLKNGSPRRDWIRLDTDRNDDPIFASLTMFEKSVLTGIMEYTGRCGRWMQDDSKFIVRALRVMPKEAHCIPRAVRKLTTLGFLVLCNQQKCEESALQYKTIHKEDVTGHIEGDTPPINPTASPQKTAKPERHFIKPSRDEVLEYMVEVRLTNPSHAVEKFLDHYTANGWRVGRNPMKDWRAAVRTWKRNETQYGRDPHDRGQQQLTANLKAGEEALRIAAERDRRHPDGNSDSPWGDN